MKNEARKLKSGVVSLISYRCTTPGPEVEEGTIEAFWTGEVDAWGKRTLNRVDGGPTYYLFDREILTVDPI